MSRRRPLVPDLDLWTALARGIQPLTPRRRVPAEPEKHVTPQPLAPQETPRRDAPVVTPARRPPKGPPPLGGLDRRTERRMLRGDVEIGARLDLHGESVTTARVRLLAFLSVAVREGHRTVLVVTGKGASPFSQHTLHGRSHYHAPEREGRLRRLLTEWIGEPEFRQHVSAMAPAHPRHGGGGAFYLRLRRPRA